MVSEDGKRSFNVPGASGKKGLQLTTDYGASWSTVSDTTVESIAFTHGCGSLSLKYQWAFAQYNSYVRSTDYGKTWTSSNSLSGYKIVGSDASQSGKHVVAYHYRNEGRVMVSSDYGVTWSENLVVSYSDGFPGATYASQVFVSTSGKTMYIACNYFMYVSTDYGKNWNTQYFKTVDEDSIYATGGFSVSKDAKSIMINAGHSSFYLSKDWGKTYTLHSIKASSNMYGYFSSLSKSGEIVTVIGDSNLAMSVDHGLTWSLDPQDSFDDLDGTLFGAASWKISADGSRMVCNIDLQDNNRFNIYSFATGYTDDSNQADDDDATFNFEEVHSSRRSLESKNLRG